jgi:hypothetical protein
MEHTAITVDLAKSVFQVAVSHRAGSVDDERRLPRDRALAFFAQQPWSGDSKANYRENTCRAQ